MNRQEYMEALEKALQPYDDQLRKDIMDDFEDHFVYGLKSGHTEEQIIDSLGSIEEMLKNIDDAVDNKPVEKQQSLVKSTMINKVIIDTKSAGVDVLINQSFDKDVHYEFNEASSYFNIKQSELKVKRYVEDDTLFITLDKDGSDPKLFSLFQDGTLSVAIPKEISLLNINGKHGDIDLIDVIVDNVKIATISGDISLDKVKCKKIQLHTTNGDIDINDSIGEITANTVNGDIDVDECDNRCLIVNSTNGDVKVDAQVEEMAIKVVNGDIDVCLDDKISKLYIETTSGDVDVSVAANVDFSGNVESLRGDVSVDVDFSYMVKRNRYVFTEGKTLVDIKSLNGDINIEQSISTHKKNKANEGIKKDIHEALNVLKDIGNLENLIDDEELKKFKDLMAQVKIDIKRKK